MQNEPQNRTCQNCKKDFIIEPEDFLFYEKIKVPAPTFCPECRFIRRMSWRNERGLYKRSCSLCKKSMISIYPADSIFPVYCKDCWYGDGWDPSSYGRSYDFSKPFFEQYYELSLLVPKIGIWQRNAVNSEYSNMCGECKNVYLSVSVVLGSENVFYSRAVDKSFNIFDSYNVKESDSCYENIDGEKNYNSQYLLLSRNCIDSYFLVDCANCSNCVLSSNLRNKEFYIRNTKFSKEEYFEEIKKLKLGSKIARKSIILEFESICKRAIYRYAHVIKSVDSVGNNILNSKNVIKSFDVFNTENAKYCYRILNMKDVMDVDFGGKAELMYEYSTGSLNDYNIRFSYSAMGSVQNAEYTESCVDCKNIFGCIALQKKENAILNKTYSKEEYNELQEKIIEHMNKMPYIDAKGIVYKYGEFFPTPISSFSYNETMAQDFLPLTKEKAITEGYKWRDTDENNYSITLQRVNIPDDINNIDNDILKEVLECSHKNDCNHRCTKAFKIIGDELDFYKKHDIPIPAECSNCRYYERFAKILPPKLWHRKCMHEGCTNEFETSYAPERPEIVYCEKCYQQEVY